MIQENKMYYGLDDIAIMPARISFVESRKDCYIVDDNKKLPIFVAPMSCIINMENVDKFDSAGLNVIIPRNIDLNDRLKVCEKYFIAVGLDEFKWEILKYNVTPGKPIKICVDIANGHMKKLLDLCKKAKEKFGPDIILMAGNIANPETILNYADAGIDYARTGIGGGGACLTSVQTSIHTSLASLLNDIQIVKEENPDKIFPKIIADGGIDSYDKAIKCFALGADYVMCGKIFAKCEEACGETFKAGIAHDIYRKYYGMSTKKAQQEMGKKELHTSEGIESAVLVEYPLSTWIENFGDYLRSAMSYVGTIFLSDFKKRANVILISNNERRSYAK